MVRTANGCLITLPCAIGFSACIGDQLARCGLRKPCAFTSRPNFIRRRQCNARCSHHSISINPSTTVLRWVLALSKTTPFFNVKTWSFTTTR